MSAPDRTAAKRAAARAFDRALRLAGYTNAVAANLLGLSQTRVRRLRSDDAADLDVVPSVADLLLADHALGEHYLAELRVERLALHGAPPAVTIEHHAMAVLAADGDVTHQLALAMADGVLAPHEVPDVERALAASEAARAPLRAALRAALRRAGVRVQV